MDFAIVNLNKIDDGRIQVPSDWSIQTWICDPRPDVERYWIHDDSAPDDVEGKLVNITITVEGKDAVNGAGQYNADSTESRVYISNYEILEG
jgi:hypothetical protein